ncbi:MAG: SDR family oxidoreductase [Fluviicola sp.]|nr:SDR family oxidoreductase [Fluviicola sp.]
MEKKNVLIIGASGGLGINIAAFFHNKGFNLALHCNGNLETLASNFEESASIKFFQANILSEEEISRMVSEVEKSVGKIDILINAAGISSSSVTWKTSFEEWNETLGINLTGPFLCIKHVLPIMRENNFGRIVNISSVVAQSGVVGTAAYSASKAGLIGMVKTIAKEVANKNITVNNIALGYFNAGMINNVPEDLQETIKASIPKKEFGEMEELTNCLEYLTSDDAGYLTGQTINLNGGMYS